MTNSWRTLTNTRSVRADCDMQDPQTASAFFFMPVAAAYLVACGGWLLYDRRLRRTVTEPLLAESDRPVLDFLLALAAATDSNESPAPT